ncbi:MAG: preprotein translocase subunit YajC [Spirochaetae bacterium HGW-Spirochaetae-3]|jgi:preprotein translocase subunit YajC|nr:MAG: preprotein translocase subunit YajC [Spirochaetae bacterium HGW-Spirochaetae-3]
MNSLFSGLSLFQAANSTGSMISTVVMFGAVFAIFYFLIIRPQNKKQKEAQKMIAAIKKGDRIVTIGGIHGVVNSVKDKTVIIKVDDSAKLEFSKSAVATVETRGDDAEAPAPAVEDKKENSK